jgi:hypothetical protein
MTAREMRLAVERGTHVPLSHEHVHHKSDAQVRAMILAGIRELPHYTRLVESGVIHWKHVPIVVSGSKTDIARLEEMGVMNTWLCGSHNT